MSFESFDFTSRRLEGVKVLVVDDSIDNSKLAQTFLKCAGAQVEVANGGKEGVAAALDNRPDLVLMDVSMPDMDGNEAVRFLRDQGFTSPVVALTAHAGTDERQRSMDAGYSDYLVKPYSGSQLVSAVEKWASVGH